ncbi:MAG: DUF3737 family protein [Clostridia bacterium]|nr:DUF3737 family protein [Clostridia bacterium]
MPEIIKNQQFEQERALYNLRDTVVENCEFAGAADGESVLKEARDIQVKKCSFSLRYPLWHVRGFLVEDCALQEPSRAPLWYCTGGVLKNTKIRSVKAVRECKDIKIHGCDIISPEFGWKNSGMEIENTSITSEYVFFGSDHVTIKGLHLSGKYSFQYMEDLIIEDSVLDTKDAFWHSKNITVKNSVVKGEYLAWFSENLTLQNCRIIGTQPLCYCKNLKLIDCTMEECDLSFEYSDVQARVIGHIDSVKNPRSGEIICESVGEIIREDAVMECTGSVRCTDSE